MMRTSGSCRCASSHVGVTNATPRGSRHHLRRVVAAVLAAPGRTSRCKRLHPSFMNTYRRLRRASSPPSPCTSARSSIRRPRFFATQASMRRCLASRPDAGTECSGAPSHPTASRGTRPSPSTRRAASRRRRRACGRDIPAGTRMACSRRWSDRPRCRNSMCRPCSFALPQAKHIRGGGLASLIRTPSSRSRARRSRTSPVWLAHWTAYSTLSALFFDSSGGRRDGVAGARRRLEPHLELAAGTPSLADTPRASSRRAAPARACRARSCRRTAWSGECLIDVDRVVIARRIGVRRDAVLR